MHFFKAHALLGLAASQSVSGRVVRRQDVPFTTNGTFTNGTFTNSTLTNNTLAAPREYILEFAQGADLTKTSDLIAQRTGVRILKQFDSDVFTGVSVESTTDNVDSFQALDVVLQAWTNKKVQLTPWVEVESFADDATAPAYSVHNATGVDKAHKDGIFGKGAVVAIIDSGTQYTHPALGGCFGKPGCRIAGGYDFVGNGPYGKEGVKKEPDEDPMDQLGHGTHVAGILMGKSNQFVGVAPEATYLSYKVFGSINSADSATLMEAIIAADKAGADVITASVGAPGGWGEDPWAVLASRMVEKGIVVTIAAGNTGTQGPFYHDDGSSGEFVLSVANIEATTLEAPGFRATFDDGKGNKETTEVAYMPGWDAYFPATIKNMPIKPLAFDTTVKDEACQPYPAGSPDLSNVIALVKRGGCDFDVKQANLFALGAKYILIYQNEEGLIPPWSSSWDTAMLGMIDAKAGEAIINQVKAGGVVTADFSLDPETNYFGMYNSAGGRPAETTSYGGTFDLVQKPDIAAHGGKIFSTYPDNRWFVLSGTSMATPYVAGVAALWIGKNGGRKVHGPEYAKQLAARIMSSGNTVKWSTDGTANKDYGFWAPTVQAGNGLIDAQKVLNYVTQLSYSKISLNDTVHFKGEHSVDITNKGTTPLKYTFAVQDAGGFEAWQPLDENVFESPRVKKNNELVPTKMVPKIALPVGEFSVGPGETKQAKFTFEPLTGNNMPVYSGKILISSSTGEQLAVPYFGVGSDVRKTVRKQFLEGWPTITSGIDFKPITEKNTFSFDRAEDKQDFPRLCEKTNWGVRETRWDIYDASWTESKWKYPPVKGQDGYVGSVAYYAWSGTSNDVVGPGKDITDTISFPVNFLQRNLVQCFWWHGRLTDNTAIAPGSYTMRFAALMPFGDPAKSEDWDAFVYPFTITKP